MEKPMIYGKEKDNHDKGYYDPEQLVTIVLPDIQN